jgi:hypothetical protein
MAGTVIVAGSVAQRPNAGGHTWVFLQYLLGFRDLGWDVLLLDRLEPDMCVDASGDPCPLESSVNLRYLQEVLKRLGLADSYALLYDDGATCLGMSRDDLMERVSRSTLLLNVNGFIADEQVLERANLRAFLDIDPGFGQMWRELGQCNLFAGHDRFVSVGLNVGRPGCTVPDCGLAWISTLPPVALDDWPVTPGGAAFTTVASWRGSYDPVEYGGHRYGLRVHEFRKFIDLPGQTAAKFEVALAIDKAETADLRQLDAHGWIVLDAADVASDPLSYNRFIGESGAEFTVAKGMYVDTRSGWFSDRSACYLASGKPVVAQDTGFSAHLPSGEGLIAFDTPDEAAAAVEDVVARPRAHLHAAREIAEEHLDARRVLPRLIAELGIERTDA